MTLSSIDTRPTPGQLAHETWFVLSGGTAEDAAMCWRAFAPKRRDIWEAVAERVICRFLADHLEVDDTSTREELERMLCEWGNEPERERYEVLPGVWHAVCQMCGDTHPPREVPYCESCESMNRHLAARLASAAMGEPTEGEP